MLAFGNRYAEPLRFPIMTSHLHTPLSVRVHFPSRKFHLYRMNGFASQNINIEA